MCRKLDKYSSLIDVLEINLSCPNVKAGCMTIGSDPEAVKHLVSKLEKSNRASALGQTYSECHRYQSHCTCGAGRRRGCCCTYKHTARNED